MAASEKREYKSEAIAKRQLVQVGQACTELENAQTPCRPDPRAPLRRR